MSFSNWKVLSWEKSRFNVFRLQLRIFKSVLVSDLKKCFAIQNVLLKSNSARLLSIKLSFNKNISTLSNQDNFAFSKKLNLNNLLFERVFNWTFNHNFFSLGDFAWEQLVLFSLLPAHEAVFSPLNFGFRSFVAVNSFQSILLLKLKNHLFSDFFNILEIKIKISRFLLNFKYLLNNILISRNIKFTILNYLKLGAFLFSYSYEFSSPTFMSFLLNVLVDKFSFSLDYIHISCLYLFFLTPKDNKIVVFHNLSEVFMSRGILISERQLKLFSLYDGFDFMGWYFRIGSGNTIFCVPSFLEYNSFLKRIKSIINNSNYGALNYILLTFCFVLHQLFVFPLLIFIFIFKDFS